MAKRTPLQSVIVHRPNPDDPKKPIRVIPEIGKPFEFTADEIKQIEKANPSALSTKAVVDLTEDGKPLGTEDDSDDDSKESSDVKASKAKGGKKAAHTGDEQL